MRILKLCAAGALSLGIGILGGCQEPAKATKQQAAGVAELPQQTNAPALARSQYRAYRWMTDEEMVRYSLGYDPTMDAGTRYVVEQAVDDNLADKGFRRGEPADLVVAFSDVYIDRNRSDPGWPFEGPGMDAVEGVSGSQMEAYADMEVYRTPEEAFTILFLDARTHHLLWRGTGREHFRTVQGEQSDDAIISAVYRAMDGMPVPLK